MGTANGNELCHCGAKKGLGAAIELMKSLYGEKHA